VEKICGVSQGYFGESAYTESLQKEPPRELPFAIAGKAERPRRTLRRLLILFSIYNDLFKAGGRKGAGAYWAEK
jgi:hypothetical protein